ncbi:mannose-1-phosphate guanylyltransferase/mannose-6-phosphate isomerase [Vibrio panuliri]
MTNELSMLQTTFERLSGIPHISPLVICNEAHRFVAAEQIRQGSFKHSGIILEPVGRNTAPAIALAAMQALDSCDGNDPTLLVLAADHIIQNVPAFIESIELALPYASSGQLVTFGIVPDAPETGYGYIKRGISHSVAVGGFKVDRFVEKPDLKTAEEYVKTGEYYWNSGMFMFKASRYLDELKQHNPEIYNSCKKAFSGALSDFDFIRVEPEAFFACPSDSIDYAVMEKTSDATVIPMDAGWSDVGSWSALWDISEKDDKGNVTKGDVITIGSSGNYIHSESKLVAAVGIDDLVVVEAKDAVLIANRSKVQLVKSIVERLKNEDRNEYKIHREAYRPWGKYDSLDVGIRDSVKRITVYPGKKLSKQMHHHRAEHWIVVSGTAKVTIGDNTFIISEDQSTFIPLGTLHALENPGKIPLEIIEVQTGEYLGEDDIVRFETNEVFGRK